GGPLELDRPRGPRQGWSESESEREPGEKPCSASIDAAPGTRPLRHRSALLGSRNGTPFRFARRRTPGKRRAAARDHPGEKGGWLHAVGEGGYQPAGPAGNSCAGEAVVSAVDPAGVRRNGPGRNRQTRVGRRRRGSAPGVRGRIRSYRPPFAWCSGRSRSFTV